MGQRLFPSSLSRRARKLETSPGGAMAVVSISPPEFPRRTYGEWRPNKEVDAKAAEATKLLNGVISLLEPEYERHRSKRSRRCSPLLESACLGEPRNTVQALPVRILFDQVRM
jgi:hypothetical protein